MVVLHGFTQAASSMRPLSDLLVGSHEVLALDLPGHGSSSDVSADLEQTARLVVDAADGEPFDLVGYSLGGRVALHVASLAPDTLGRVVAISASPGIADPAARARRLERDCELAATLEADGDVEAFLARWLANPLFATVPAAAADLEGRRSNTARGLADSLRLCSVGTQRLLLAELRSLDVPVLMLAGSRDDPFVARACDVAHGARSVRAAVVAGSGHACQLEQPALTAALIGAFLSR